MATFWGVARQLHEVPFWSPRKAEALFREGQSYLKLDRAKDAEDAWLLALKDDPLHPISPDLFHDLSQELLKIYAIEDRWDDAYPVMWEAYDRASPADRPAYLAMRMRPELEQRRAQGVDCDLEALRRGRGRRLGGPSRLARAEQALGNHDEAARLFQVCLKGNPQNIRAWRDYLTLLLEHGDQDAFLALLANTPKAAEAEPETWFFRGVASEHAEDLQGAATCLSRAIKLNPYVPRYLYRLATVEQRLGLHDEARVHRAQRKR